MNRTTAAGTTLLAFLTTTCALNGLHAEAAIFSLGALLLTTGHLAHRHRARQAEQAARPPDTRPHLDPCCRLWTHSRGYVHAPNCRRVTDRT
ncbi:hypothetical protein [Streptomyces sp. NPDC096153]|uniref:hypothetical protein n=1 Tax=Streptomyces sp. NPDC096153 TaxID=3155548 RepID=UPI00332DEA62